MEQGESTIDEQTKDPCEVQVVVEGARDSGHASNSGRVGLLQRTFSSASATLTTITTLGRNVSRRLVLTQQEADTHVYDLDGIKIESASPLQPSANDSPHTITMDGLNSFVVRRPPSQFRASSTVSRFFSTAQSQPQTPGSLPPALDDGQVDRAAEPTVINPEVPGSPFSQGGGQSALASPSKPISTLKEESRIKQYFNKWKGVGDSPLPRPPFKEIAFTFTVLFISMSVLSALDFFLRGYMDGFDFIVPSCGASAILIFGLPESKMAQPRTIIGGQLISSFIGVSVRQMFVFRSDIKEWFWISGPLSCSLSLAAMQLTRTTNPPGGAAALVTSVLGPDLPAMDAYKQVVSCLLGNTILVALGVLLNNLRPSRRYPTHWW